MKPRDPSSNNARLILTGLQPGDLVFRMLSETVSTVVERNPLTDQKPLKRLRDLVLRGHRAEAR